MRQHKTRFIAPFFAIALLFLGMNNVWAAATSTKSTKAQYESTQALQATARNYLYPKLAKVSQDYTIEFGETDSRLKLDLCPKATQAFLPPGRTPQKTSVVGIRCSSDAVNWTVYLPVKVLIFQHVVVSSRPLRAGMNINKNDVLLQRVDINKLHRTYYKEVDFVIGRTVRSNIRPGGVLTPYNTTPAILVNRGQLVEIAKEINGATVTTRGIAQSNGTKGELIVIKNSKSGKTLQAVVTGAGMVKVP